MRVSAFVTGALLLTSAASTGGALVTTRSTVFDSSFNTAPYSLSYGIFQPSLRPHIGNTFSEGTQGYLVFKLFDGDTPPMPLPVTGVGQSMRVTIELTRDLALDRTRPESGVNWCHRTPNELHLIIWAGPCNVTEYDNGASVVQFDLMPRRDLTTEDFELLNRVRVGVGVIGRPGIVDGTGHVYAGMSILDYGRPGSSRQSKLADVEYRTISADRSDLGIHNLVLVNENPRPGDQIFQPGDTGRMTFDVAPASGLPVRMRTGESFTISVDPPWVSENSYLEFIDVDDLCPSPGEMPGYEVECELVDAPGNGLKSTFIRSGPDTEDAFPAGLSITLRLGMLGVDQMQTDVRNLVTISADMTQSGSRFPVATSTVDFWPRRSSAPLHVRGLEVYGEHGQMVAGEDSVIEFAFLPTEVSSEDEPLMQEGAEVELRVDMPTAIFDTGAGSRDVEEVYQHDHMCDALDWDEATSGLSVSDCVMESDDGVERLVVTLQATADVDSASGEHMLRLRVPTETGSTGEEDVLVVEAVVVGEENTASRSEVPIAIDLGPEATLAPTPSISPTPRASPSPERCPLPSPISTALP